MRHEESVQCVVYSADGKLLASGSSEGRIIVWNIELNTLAVALKDLLQGTCITSLAFSPNTSWLASGSLEEIRIWNVITGDMGEEPFHGHGDFVRSVNFSPDGSRIVTGSDDGAIRIWSLETREEVMSPLRQEHPITSVMYSRDGSQILSASHYGVTFWNSLTGKPIISTSRPINILNEFTKNESYLNLDNYQFIKGWKYDGGWLRDASGGYRLLLTGYMHKYVRQVDEGIYIHHDFHLNLCNAVAKDFRGFILLS